MSNNNITRGNGLDTENFVDDIESVVSIADMMGTEDFVDEVKSEVSNTIFSTNSFIDDTESIMSRAAETMFQDVADEDKAYEMGEYFVIQGTPREGQGGQAQIYKCHKAGTDETYIAKIYRENLKGLNKIIELEENVQSINSDNVVKNLFVGMAKNRRNLVVVMPQYEKFDKKSNYLNYKMHGQDADYEHNFLQAVIDLNNGMKAFHARGIIHSDIKPENIMCTTSSKGRKKLVFIDLGGGIDAKGRNAHSLQQADANNAFTLGYMAPEIYQGRRISGNPYTDAYSVGVTLAEYMAGVLPVYRDLKRGTADNRVRAYFRENAGENEKHPGQILLPKNIPDYIYRLFQGLLYVIDDDEESDARWGSENVDQWIELVKNRRYDEAAALPAKINVKRNQTEAFGSVDPNARVIIPFKDESVPVNSAAGMVEAILKPGTTHLKEMITNLMIDEDWANSFRKIDPNLVTVLKSARAEMNDRPNDAERIFVKRVLYTYADEEVRDYLIRNGRIFKNKAELGKYIYSNLAEGVEKGQYNNLRPYKELAELKKMDSFIEMMYLFEKGFLSRFVENGHAGFDMDEENLNRIRIWEKRMNSPEPNKPKGMADDLVELFRLAFYLQEMPCLKTDRGIFVNGQDLGKTINDLEVSKPGTGISFMRKLYAGGNVNYGLTPPVYAWMMDAPGVEYRPDESKKPGEQWERINCTGRKAQ